MIDDKNQPEQRAPETTLEENLLGVGQRILGNLETLGGILTGDPITTSEGEFNAAVGTAHQDSNRVLTAIEREEEQHD